TSCHRKRAVAMKKNNDRTSVAASPTGGEQLKDHSILQPKGVTSNSPGRYPLRWRTPESLPPVDEAQRAAVRESAPFQYMPCHRHFRSEVPWDWLRKAAAAWPVAADCDCQTDS